MATARAEVKSDPFFQPLMCRVWLRPAAFLGRMARLQPANSILTTLVVSCAGLTEGLALSLLLPLMSLVGVGSGARPGGPARAVERVFTALGVPLSLGWVLVLFFSVGMAQIALHAGQQFLIARSSERLTLFLRRRLFDSASRAAWAALLQGRGGHLVNAVVSESNRIGIVYGDAMTAFGLILNFLVYAGLAAWLSWRFTLLTLVVGCLSMLALRRVFRSSRRFGAYTSAATNRMQEVINEHIGAAKLIRSLGAGAWSRATFDDAAAAVGRYVRNHADNTALVRVCVEPLGLLLVVAMIYVSLGILHIPAAEAILLVLIFYRVTPRLVQLQELLQRIAGVLPAYEAVCGTLKHLDAERETDGSKAYGGLRVAIQMKDVVVRHGERTVLRGINLGIPARTTVALVGPSGGGKTTLLDVLTGVLTPASGAVLADGVPLLDLDLETFRRRIGIVHQECVFFHDTIRANVRLSAPEVRDAAIWEALQAAHADEFVRARPGGLDAVMGDQGLRLSGGQRQRLALARALLRNPDILLLDEPSSALDAESETAIRSTLAGLHGTMTIVVVSHRASLVQGADVVYRIEDGRVVTSHSGAEKQLGQVDG